MAGCTPGAGSANVTSRSRPPARMRPAPLAFAQRNHGLSDPYADRVYRSSPTRTTQIVTYGRSVPSGRAEVTRSTSASPIRLSSALVHVVTSAAEDLLGHPDGDEVPDQLLWRDLFGCVGHGWSFLEFDCRHSDSVVRSPAVGSRGVGDLEGPRGWDLVVAEPGDR